MHRYIFFLLTAFLLFVTGPQSAAANDYIAINLPQSVLAKAISTALPLNYPANSKTLNGTLILKSINDLKIIDNHILCRMHITGENMQFVTEVAGHKIKLDVGSVELGFKTKAQLRFDQAKQVLYVTPVIDEVDMSNDAGGGDIGRALVTLLNGRELPVNLSSIDPIVAETGTKSLLITTRIANITAKKERIQLYLDPLFTVK